MERTILHCDCNSFFASVETLLCPALADVPMAVCGDVESRHGIILAKNEKAKAFDIKTAETVWKAKRKCPDLVLVSPHRDEYVKYSRLCNELYLQYTDLVDPFGIDESFLDVTGSLHLFGTGEQIANEIRKRMKEEIGLTISVGVSFNKAFAKLGSDYKKPDATTVFSPENFKEKVWPLPVDTLLYVGRKVNDKLKRLGVYTIGDLAKCDEKFARSVLGKMGETLLAYAKGEDHEKVRSFYEEREVKSVGNGMTFAQDLCGEEEFHMGIATLCDNVGRRLRRQKMKCYTVQLSIKDPDFKTKSRQVTLETPIDSTKEMIRISMELLHAVWQMDKPVRLFTVTVTNLISNEQAGEQLSLFAEQNKKAEKQHSLDQTMDQLRGRFGKESVFFAHDMKKKK